MSIPVSTILAGLREHEAETAERVAKLTRALSVATADLEALRGAIAAMAPRPSIPAVAPPITASEVRDDSLSDAIRHVLRTAGRPLTTGDVVAALPERHRNARLVSSTLSNMARGGAVRCAESVPYGRTVRNRWCLAPATEQE